MKTAVRRQITTAKHKDARFITETSGCPWADKGGNFSNRAYVGAYAGLETAELFRNYLGFLTCLQTSGSRMQDRY
jgi:hypothetical protein